MKTLICSDAHTDRKTHRMSRYDEIEAAFLQTVEVAIKERVDYWAFLGDLCDPEDPAELLRALSLVMRVDSELHRAGIKRIWVTGNHDVVGDGRGTTTLSPLQWNEGAFVARMPSVGFTEPLGIVASRVSVVCLPYPSYQGELSYEELLKEWVPKLSNNERVIVFGHASEVDGALMGDESTEMKRGKGVRLPTELIPAHWKVFNGHYHRPQSIGNVVIPGAMARLSHGEETNSPRFVIVHV